MPMSQTLRSRAQRRRTQSVERYPAWPAARWCCRITVKTNPAGQACLVSNGTGTATANVTSVVVTCSAAVPLTITVDATGISGGGSLIVSDGIGANLTFAIDGNQAFANTYASGASYTVTIAQNPTGETCSLSSNAV